MTTDLVGLDDRFDVLTMYHVLEHIPNPIAAMATVKELAKPGGLIVVEVPNVGAAPKPGCRDVPGAITRSITSTTSANEISYRSEYPWNGDC